MSGLKKITRTKFMENTGERKGRYQKPCIHKELDVVHTCSCLDCGIPGQLTSPAKYMMSGQLTGPTYEAFVLMIWRDALSLLL